MRAPILAVMLIVPGLLLHAEGVEDRLLEGEILEVSKGDLEKAMAIYKAIHADENAPEPARARSLLYLARCQRKLGEIEAARKTLDELVKAHAKEEEVIRQARSFLRELESGKAESPRFDWLREMEKSPEVQAKAFDLVMDVALSPSTTEHQRAMRQLRALGMLSVPVLERVFETSRDVTQRQSIAILLSQIGKYDRLPILLEPGSTLMNPLSQYFQTLLVGLPDLDERARKDFLAAVERAPEGSEKSIVRQLCLLASAREDDLSGLLRGLETFVGRWSTFGVREILLKIVERAPPAAKALAGRIIDPACPVEARPIYFDVLLRMSPGSLEAAQYVAYIATLEGDKVTSLLGQLPDESKFEILLPLAGGAERDAVTNLFWSTGGVSPQPRRAPPPRVRGQIPSRVPSRVPSQTPSPVATPDPRWVPVLREAKSWKALHVLAETNDAAIPDIVEFLRNRQRVAPEYRGCHTGGDCQHATPWNQPGGGPSPAFVEAMTGLLDVEDPITLAIALESLSLGRPDVVAPAFPAIERLARGAADDRVRELALHALVTVFGTDPEKTPLVARTFFDEFQRRRATTETPESYARSPLFDVEALGSTWMKTTSTRRFEETLDGVFGVMGDAPREALYPAVLRLANGDGGAPFERSFSSRWRQNDNALRTRYLAVAAPHLEVVTSPEPMVSVAEKLNDGLRASGKRESLEAAAGSAADAARIAAFFRRVASEPELPLKLRLTVFEWGGAGAFEWLDWKTFLAKDDPFADIVDGILFKSSWFQARPDPAKSSIIDAALASPRAPVRKAAVGQVSLERKDAAEVLRRAIDDADFGVRGEAIKRLAGMTRTDVAPVFHDLLESPHTDVRAGVVQALIRFADPKSIEPIVKLLDDPDVDVRTQALQAVKEIRKTLEERDEWKKWAKDAARPAKEARKD